MKSMLTCAVSSRCVVLSPFIFPIQVFDEELDGERSVVEKTVNLSVADGEVCPTQMGQLITVHRRFKN